MIRIMLLLPLLVMGFVANAQWYLVGDGIGWSEQESLRFQPTASPDVYVLEVMQLNGPFKIKEKATWETSFGSNGELLIAGETYFAKKDGQNISVGGEVRNALITINTKTLSILVVGDWVPDTDDSWYLVGDINGWEESSEYLFSPTADENVFKLEVPLLSGYFKIKKKGTWSEAFGSDGKFSLVEGVLYEAEKSANQNIRVYNEIIDAVITINTMAYTILVQKEVEPQPVRPAYLIAPNAHNFPNLWYDAGDSMRTIDKEKYNGSNIWILSLARDVVYVDMIKFGVYYSDREYYKDKPIEVGHVYKMYDFQDENGRWQMSLDDLGKLYDAEGVINYPEELYLVGNRINGLSNDPENGLLMMKDGAEYSIDGVVFESTSLYDHTCDFSFTTRIADDWGTVNQSMRFGDHDGWATSQVPGENWAVHCYPASENSPAIGVDWSISPGVYDIKVNLEKMEITVKESTSSIQDAVAPSGQTPVYYSLQGILVERPERGVFIEVDGNASRKVVIR